MTVDELIAKLQHARMVVRRIERDERETLNHSVILSVAWAEGWRTIEQIEWHREHGYIIRVSPGPMEPTP